MCDRRRDLRSIVSEVFFSFGAVQSILTGILGMSKVSARWVPRMLTDDQKRTRLFISRYLQSCNEDDPGDFIERVVFQDDMDLPLLLGPKCKANNGNTKKFKRAHSAGKVMASIFWDSQGVVMIYCLEQSRMINSAYYAGELRRLLQEIARGEEN